MLFGSDELKARLRAYDTSCKYNYAVSVFHNRRYAEAKKLFEELQGYKDAESRIEECIRGIEQQKIEQEKQRMEAEQAAKRVEEERKMKERKKIENISVTKLILTCGILFLLFFPFLITEMRHENDGLGQILFAASIVLSIPCGIAYIIITVVKIVLKKKNTYGEFPHGQKSGKTTKITTALLVLLTIAAYAFSFLSIGCGIGEYLTYFALFAVAFMLLSVITDDWKQLFQSKAVISALAFGIAYIINSLGIVYSDFYRSQFDMAGLLIAAALTIVGFVLHLILKIIQKKRYQTGIGKKNIIQYSLSIFAAILCVAFCSISLIVCANREVAVKEELKGKIMNYTTNKSTGVPRFGSYGYVFDENARYRSLGTDGKVSTYGPYYPNINFMWFGFGDVYMNYNDLIIFDENNQVVGICEYIYRYNGFSIEVEYVVYYEVVDSILTNNADTK